MNRTRQDGAGQDPRDFSSEADFLLESQWTWPFGPRRIRGANDEQGHLVRDFTPTRGDLEALAAHYLNEIYEIDYECLFQIDVNDLARREFLSRRLEAVVRIIGEDRAQSVLDPITERWRKDYAETEARMRRGEIPGYEPDGTAGDSADLCDQDSTREQGPDEEARRAQSEGA
jgi:hypothetical protein